jgi:hypothetical protein
LVDAIVRGGPMETVVNQLKVEEARKKAPADQLASLGVSGAIARELKAAAADVKTLLAGTTTPARQMLRLILDGEAYR